MILTWQIFHMKECLFIYGSLTANCPPKTLIKTSNADADADADAEAELQAN